MAMLLLHPDYQRLLWPILVDPADDLPRLVLADWLEEYAFAERAELIRTQIHLANNRPEELTPTSSLARREANLLNHISGEVVPGNPRPEWVGEATVTLLSDQGSWHWARGFVSRVVLPEAVSLSFHFNQLVSIFREQPIQSVVYHYRSGVARRTTVPQEASPEFFDRARRTVGLPPLPR